MSFFNLRDLTEDYEKSLKEYGPGPKALLWWDYRSMAIRFRELVADLPSLDGKSILDAGCGMGDLLPYLYARSSSFRYLGVDTNKGFIDIAKERYEGHQFKVADPFKHKAGDFDVVISSGVMNGNRSGWLEERKRMIEALFDQTNQVLAFNMAGSLKPIKHDSLIAYADAQEILEYCKTLSKRVILRAHYLEKDFTIVMFKKNFSA
jgi:trans-aconitate methyltransferase